MIKFKYFFEASQADMEAKIKKAFKEVDQKLIDSDQKWAREKLTGLKAHMANVPIKSYTAEKVKWFGGKAMMNLIADRGLEEGLKNMRKNTEALIAKRNLQIIAALTKKGIKEIPDFELKHVSDGYEGSFTIDQHTVVIHTILAGGYNIQRLHQRTLVKIR